LQIIKKKCGKVKLDLQKARYTSFQITILKKPQTQEIRDKAITVLRGNNLCNNDKSIAIKNNNIER
jgi:hypothetical protein